MGVAELALASLGGHPGVHAVRDVLLPGAGLVDERPLLGAALIAAWLVAVVAWVRWGADWIVLLVTAVAISLTLSLTAAHDGSVAALPRLRAAHEFPVVIVVVAVLSRLRALLVRMPFVGSLFGGSRTASGAAVSIGSLPPVDRARAIAITTLADPTSAASLRPLIDAPDLSVRARRVGAVARGRFTGDPLHRDHAHLRAARLLVGMDGGASLAADAARSPVGLPCSEPTWIRPVDAVLAAIALDRAGRHDAGLAITALLQGPWRLRSRTRPAWLWTPGTIAAGAALPWEHATITALARAAGWLTTDEDWQALRKRALGAAARHDRHRDDERLIAAARLWLVFVDDPEASVVLGRPSLTDPLALALDALAVRLVGDPGSVRRPSRRG